MQTSLNIANNFSCGKMKKIVLHSVLFLTSVSFSNKLFSQTETISDPVIADTVVMLVNQLPNKNRSYPVLYKDLVPQSQLVQSIGFLKGKYLESTPANSPAVALMGRIAGLTGDQPSGEPGYDVPSFSLRGRSPLVLIDGVPRSAPAINPEQIESVTVLKDALATAMLGMRGMNGAILITTKKGKDSESRFNLNVKAQGGFQSPIKMKKFVNAFDYATLYNEALANDGKPAAYTQADLDAYKNHTDPYGHPDVDWTSAILKDRSFMSRYTVNAEGQTPAVNYFVSLDYLNQGGMFKEIDSNSYNTNSNFKRYIFRSNLEMKITNRMKAFLNLFGRIREGNYPGAGGSSVLAGLTSTPNNAYPVTNPNGSLGGNVLYTNNLFGQTVFSGYTTNNISDGFVDVGFTRQMDDLVKGWWIKAMVSYNTSLTHNTDRSKWFQVWQMRVNAPGDTSYTRFGPDPLPQQANSSYVSTRTQQFYTEVSTGISRSFNGNGIDVTLLGNSDNYTSGSLLPDTYKSLAANFKYNYSDKYILELSGAYSGNNRFQPGHQYGFFPAAGVAWNISKENFMVNQSAINDFKLRASYGLTANANSGYYEYIYRYTGGTGYVFGSNAGGVSGLIEAGLPQMRVWEKALKLNVGVDFSFLRKGWFSFDYFKNRAQDILQAKNYGLTNDIIGIDYPLANVGKINYAGYETTLGWADKINDFGYNFSLNASVVNAKRIYNDEPKMPYPWMSSVGATGNQYYGYVADGFVTTAGAGSVIEGYQSKPGDIKYVDKNGDGVINLYDRTLIGSTKPTFNYGLNANLNYKGFYLSFLIQGVRNNMTMLTGSNVWEFQFNGLGQVQDYHLNRWTPATAATATYPRLSIGTNANNHINSTFWLQDLSYVRLRNAEIGYNLTGNFIQRLQLQSVRIFVNGLNLFTISPYKRSYPEAPLSDYPVQEIVNAGISVQL